jgi:pSer/pThr/pTyr-binding forkhead associated (FHA) protein
VVGVLVAVDGELAGALCAVRDGENRLGRAETCEIVLPSVKVSREHAKIVHSDGVFAIVPLKPENPTLVNGEATQGSELRDGDLVRVGQTTLRFRTVEGP